jgi:hypothetical protein
MNELRTSSEGRTVGRVFQRPTRRGLWLFALTIILSMVVLLPSLSTTALGQSECVLNCQEQYFACVHSPDPLPSCGELYSACIDSCLGW